MLATNFRPSRLIIVASAAVFIVLFLGIFNYMAETPFVDIPLRSNPQTPPGQRPPSLHTSPQREALTLAAAGNATLGFHKILMINMKQRWDKMDAATLQAYVSGLKIEPWTAVDGKKEITEVGGIGLPPSSGGNLGGGQAACYRSHANIWTEMVMNRSPPILIIEADASWDANLRSIMSLANRNFVEYLSEVGSKPSTAPFYETENPAENPSKVIQFNPTDPWLSEHWDIISLGHCNDQPPWFGDYPDRAYKDKWASTPGDLFSIPSGSSRVIKRSKGFACTTGYAVSHRGAAKMLHRHALDLNQPVDLVMGSMINEGDLISYTLNPPPIVQWSYATNIGMDKGADSDIFQADTGGQEEKEKEMTGWDAVHKKKSAWIVSDKFRGLKFKESALDVAYSRIFKQASPFQSPTIPGVRDAQAAPEKPDHEPPAETEAEQEQPTEGRSATGELEH